MDEEMTKCRLCNYKSDRRLMLGVFDENTEYFVKIENYLNLKVSFGFKLRVLKLFWVLEGLRMDKISDLVQQFKLCLVYCQKNMKIIKIL